MSNLLKKRMKKTKLPTDLNRRNFLTGTVAALMLPLAQSFALEEALPDTLLEQLGLDTILERVPVAYLKAIFGSYLASRFIYLHGIGSSQFAFFDFMNQKLKLV